MTDHQLFNELVKEGLLDEVTAEKMLRDAGLVGMPAEDFLYGRGIVDEVAVARTKSKILGVPFKQIDPAAVSDELLKLIPQETSENYRVIPLSRDGKMFTVGMLRPDDEKAREAVQFIARRDNLDLGVYIVTPSDLEAVWRRSVPFKNEVDRALEEIGARGGDVDKQISLEMGIERSQEAPIIKIVASMLKRAVEESVTDIHIEPQRTRLRVRFRVDGDLIEVASMPASLIQPVVSRIKVLSNLKLDEARVPQDGRFRSLVKNKDVDFRVATFPTPSGEKVAIRVLDPSVGLKGFGKLGLNEYNRTILDEATRRPYGMVLITGPTGSGKTTTLYAILQQLNVPEVNIVSLEDPVEYFVEGVSQSQVRPEIGYNFASGLRQILRQDPDIIMVGEIRDSETADLAVNAALTGHVMLATLHTNNSVGVIPRLIDLEVPPFLLSTSLNIMVAQRLVGRLCGECKKEREAPAKVEEVVKESLDKLPGGLVGKVRDKFKPPYKVWGIGGKGACKACNGKGTVGRVALFEIFRMTRQLGDIINDKFTEGMLWDEARRQGIVTLRQDGILKALEGEVMLEEVLRETT